MSERFRCKACGFVARGYDQQEEHTAQTEHRRWSSIERVSDKGAD